MKSVLFFYYLDKNMLTIELNPCSIISMEFIDYMLF